MITKNAIVLDPACGSRMFYFDRNDPRVLFGDIRKIETKLCDGRSLVVNPDLQMDFRNMPFQDNSFSCVVFDPPHLHKLGKKSWLALKYGKLENSWSDDISSGFCECFRVLKPSGVLIFKWNERDIPLSKILACTTEKPLMKWNNNLTHWCVFIKKDSE